MNLGVVVTTYNSPVWLRKVLWGYESQTDTDFTLLIADDGSGPETLAVIQEFEMRGVLNIVHYWQEDIGFRKTRILNKCIANTDCDYLVFTDGDCVPRFDYIANHKEKARKGCFVSGGLYRLNLKTSQMLQEAEVTSGHAFCFDYLQEYGQEKDFKRHKLTKSSFMAAFLNYLTPTKATWNGGNTGCWKADIIKVNGFDERMQYGGLDRELGERMMNTGVKGIQARYSVITLHLDHSRGYENQASWEKNRQIRHRVKKEKRTWTDFGLKPTHRFKDS